MKCTFVESQSTPEIQSSNQASQESQGDQPNNHTTEAPVTDSGSVSTSSNDTKKVSRQDIELVRIQTPFFCFFFSGFFFQLAIYLKGISTTFEKERDLN